MNRFNVIKYYDDLGIVDTETGKEFVEYELYDYINECNINYGEDDLYDLNTGETVEDFTFEQLTMLANFANEWNIGNEYVTHD